MHSEAVWYANTNNEITLFFNNNIIIFHCRETDFFYLVNIFLFHSYTINILH